MPSDRQTVIIADAERPFFAGVDVGGTNTKIGLLDNQGRTLSFRSITTDVERGAEDGCARMADTVRKLVAEGGAAKGDVPRVGLATPGTMDVPAGMLLEPHNLRGWWNFPIRDRLAEHVGLPVTFANDANAAAYGEYWQGTGAQFDSMILMTLGTGIGGGIIVGD